MKEIVDKILQAKKYRYIYRPTVERIVEDFARKYPEKELEKAVKKRLHQIWGAYFQRPNFKNLAAELKAQSSKLKTIESLRDNLFIKKLLELQTSTKERLLIYDQFYDKIFAITGQPKKIIEYGCGVNALSYPWMGDCEYIGYDVDRELIDFINQVFGELNIKKSAEVKLGDVFEKKFEQADVYLLMKVLVLFERQEKNISLKLLEQIPARWVVVSFPTKSISGKDRGMKQNYRRMFYQLIENKNWLIEEIGFNNEIVFVIDKNCDVKK